MPTSRFIAGNKMELMKEGGRGTLGHPAFYTPDMDRAIEYPAVQGYELDFDSAHYHEAEKTILLIYIRGEINCFGIHLTARK